MKKSYSKCLTNRTKIYMSICTGVDIIIPTFELRLGSGGIDLDRYWCSINLKYIEINFQIIQKRRKLEKRPNL